ncbi:hypothetical protein C8Q76DRAFT_695117 [Earliella scabrosa]|nr:hypothetical protein C8Q76DRAFT_695117 [Earliella scabrosa]
MAVWARAWFIVFPLVFLILVQWFLLLYGILLTAVGTSVQSCVSMSTNKILVTSHIFVMVFDFLILALTATRLGAATAPGRNRSRILCLVLQDGLAYFVTAFGVNLLAALFMLTNLNIVMSIVANIPAGVVSTIAASAVVRRLSEHRSEDVVEYRLTHHSMSTHADYLYQTASSTSIHSYLRGS